MRKTSLLERMIVRIIGEYVRIEEWTEKMNKHEEHKYIQSLVFAINEKFPESVILSAHKAFDIESRTHPYFAWGGYVIKVAGVSSVEIKLLCMQLELNEEGKRISDLDVYYQERKISRKHIQ